MKINDLVDQLSQYAGLSPLQQSELFEQCTREQANSEDVPGLFQRLGLTSQTVASTLRMVSKGYLKMPSAEALFNEESVQNAQELVSRTEPRALDTHSQTSQGFFETTFGADTPIDSRPLVKSNSRSKSESESYAAEVQLSSPMDKTIVDTRGPNPVPHFPEIGETIGKFLITEVLGQGSSAKVFKALHKTLRIPVALKILLVSPQDNSGALSEALQAEAQLLAQLNHPNILRVMDFDTHKNWPYIVLEYLEGLTLHELIEQSGRIQPIRALSIIEGAVEGLAHATKKGIIHRDVKPANILVSKDGEAKVADLGIAKIVDNFSKPNPNADSLILGTPAYISPEQIEGHNRVDFRSDMYSIGATVYHAISGQLPFPSPNIFAMMKRHVEEEAIPLQTLCPTVSADLSDFVDKLMAKNPEERFSSYSALLESLRSLPEVCENNHSLLNFNSSGPLSSPPVPSLTSSQFGQMTTSAVASISGSLGQTSIAEIIQFLQLTNKSGLLRITSADLNAEIGFYEGSAMHAEYGPCMGKEAFYEIVALGEGSFYFIENQAVTFRSLTDSTMSLLVEGMRRVDEKQQG
ncbi:MAG: protein kinase [Planctomycetota bacterium]|nr:protein kinase [Planctomycetota bacterium]